MRRWWQNIRARYDASVLDKLILTIPTATFFFWALMTFFNCFSFYQQTKSQFVDDGILISDNLLPQMEFRSKMAYRNFDSADVQYITKRSSLNEMGTIINTEAPLAILGREHAEPVAEKSGYMVQKILTDKGTVFEFTRPLKDWERRQFGFNYFSVGIAANRMYSHVLRQVLTFVGIGIVLILSQVLVIILFAKTITRPLQQVTDGVTRLLKDPMSHRSVPVPTRDEVGQLAERINEMVEQIRAYEDTQERNRALVAIGQTATQVAHDIRSPLSSINTAVKLIRSHVDQVPEAADGMHLLRLASSRLEDIANDLLKKYKGTDTSSDVFSIHEVLDELIGEYAASPMGTGIAFKKNYYSSALYVTGNKTGINRALGNIIKNALEAMEGRARSVLTVQTELLDDAEVAIHIIDTGPGIPPEKIPLILKGGHSDGKRDGYGIGTQVAKEIVEQHGGSVGLQSVYCEGTQFTIRLPVTDRTVLPRELSEVAIPYASGEVMVLDDDPGMREQWRIVLKQLGVASCSFACWEDFAVAGLELPESTTFVVDYDFQNSDWDGLRIIHHLRANGFENIVLATAEYWRPKLKDEAQDLVLCPKPLPKISIRSLVQKNGTVAPNVLVIDDDATIRMCWKVQKNMMGIGDLKMYATMEECENNAPDYSTIDVAFVDKHIEGTAWSLDRIISHLKQGGVRKVWVASGDAAEDLRADPKCAQADGIVAGKMPDNITDYTREA